MLAQGTEGHVVNTASVVAFTRGPGREPYTSSKAAVVAITEDLRTEVAGHGIGVTALVPGGVEHAHRGVAAQPARRVRSRRGARTARAGRARAVVSGARADRSRAHGAAAIERNEPVGLHASRVAPRQSRAPPRDRRRDRRCSPPPMPRRQRGRRVRRDHDERGGCNGDQREGRRHHGWWERDRTGRGHPVRRARDEGRPRRHERRGARRHGGRPAGQGPRGHGRADRRRRLRRGEAPCRRRLRDVTATSTWR